MAFAVREKIEGKNIQLINVYNVSDFPDKEMKLAGG